MEMEFDMIRSSRSQGKAREGYRDGTELCIGKQGDLFENCVWENEKFPGRLRTYLCKKRGGTF